MIKSHPSSAIVPGRAGPRRRRSGLRFVIGGSVALMLLLGLGAAPATASAQPTSWHRLNVYNDPPEHERLRCVARATWSCLYDKVPGPQLGLHWDGTRGVFRGDVMTTGWVCPAWFPGDACSSADTVVSGVGTFVFPHGQGGFSVDETLLVSDEGSLWVYWADDFQFVCPWYASFDRALVSDASCTFAP
jgi:hypothetical protein